MMLGAAADVLSPVIALSGDGTGSGIVGTLGTSWTDGTPVSSMGMTAIQLAAVVNVDSGRTLSLRAIDRRSNGDFPVQLTQVDSGPAIQGVQFDFSSTNATALFQADLGAVVGVLVFQAKVDSTATSATSIKADLTYSHGGR